MIFIYAQDTTVRKLTTARRGLVEMALPVFPKEILTNAPVPMDLLEVRVLQILMNVPKTLVYMDDVSIL